jgi:hypothetical protein
VSSYTQKLGNLPILNFDMTDGKLPIQVKKITTNGKLPEGGASAKVKGQVNWKN